MPGSERFQNKNSHHAIRRTTCVRWENETCFASGHPSRHLFLHGVQFTGKFVVRKQDVSGRRLLERQVYYAPTRYFQQCPGIHCRVVELLAPTTTLPLSTSTQFLPVWNSLVHVSPPYSSAQLDHS